MTIKHKTEIPDGEIFIIVLPNIEAMIYGAWRYAQDSRGNIGIAYSDGSVLYASMPDIDLPEINQSETYRAELFDLLPRMAKVGTFISPWRSNDCRI